MGVIADLKEGSLTLNSEGAETTRTFQVNELTGAGHAKTYAACMSPGIPRRGDPHPSIPFIFATTVVGEINGAGVSVKVTYSTPTAAEKEPDETELPTIQVGSTLQESTTSKDKDNKLIKVPFRYTPVDEDGNLGEQITEEFVPVLSVQVPQSSLEYQRRERNSPILKAIKYVGAVNQLQMGIYAARTLLCTGIEGQSSDGGITYSVSYRFQINLNTWDAEYFYIDQATGQPHKDVKISPANGYGVAKLYREIDFSPLNVIR